MDVCVCVCVCKRDVPTGARARDGYREKQEEQKKATTRDFRDFRDTRDTRPRTHLPPPVDRVVHHNPIHLDIIVRLEDSLLHIDAHALAVQPDPGLADETELKVDADLLACFLGELGVLAGLRGDLAESSETSESSETCDARGAGDKELCETMRYEARHLRRGGTTRDDFAATGQPGSSV